MEMVKLAIWYDACGSVVEVQRKFCVEFENSNVRIPSKNLIISSRKRILTTGNGLPKIRDLSLIRS